MTPLPVRRRATNSRRPSWPSRRGGIRAAGRTWGSSSSWFCRSSVPARTSLTGHLLRPDRTCAPAHRASQRSCSAFAADELLSRDPLALVLGHAAGPADASTKQLSSQGGRLLTTTGQVIGWHVDRHG